MTLHLATANVCLPHCVAVVLVVAACSLKHFRLDLYCEIKLKSFATEIKVKLIYCMAWTLTGESSGKLLYRPQHSYSYICKTSSSYHIL